MKAVISFIMGIVISIMSFFGISTKDVFSNRTLDTGLLYQNVSERAASDIANGVFCGIETVVYRNNECVLSETFGTNGVNGGKLEKNSLFRIASMTKPVTAVAVLLEAEKGNIDIYADVSDYLDGFKDMQTAEIKDGELVITGKATKPVKVYQLLSHSSGIASGELEAYYWNDFVKNGGDYDIAYVADRLSTLPLAYNPGDAQAYSTLAFDVAARIVEKTSGMPFDEYIKKYIFDPLGMKDTTFTPTTEQWDRMITMHTRSDDGKSLDRQMPTKNVFGDFPGTYYIAGGGLASTAQDYIKFAQMLLNNGVAEDGTRVMSEKSVELMKTPAVSKKIMGGDARWGLGVIVYVNSKGRLPEGSFGWSGAYGTHFFIDPADGITAVYMKNSSYAGGAGSVTANNFEQDIIDALIWFDGNNKIC